MSKNTIGVQNVPGQARQYVLTPLSANFLNNGTKFSDVTFSIPGFYCRKPNLLYTTLRLTSAYFPDSYYIVCAPYTTLELNGQLIVLPEGDYTPKQFGNLISSYLVNGTNTIVNDKFIFTSTQPFTFGDKTTSFQYLGFLKNTSISSKPNTDANGTSVYYISMPCAYQFNNPYSYFIVADPVINLATNTLTKNKYFWEVLIDQNNKTTVYENPTVVPYELEPSTNIDSLNIKIQDLNGNYIDFNGNYWTVVLQIIEYDDYYIPGNSDNNVTGNPASYPNFYGSTIGFETKRRRLF